MYRRAITNDVYDVDITLLVGSIDELRAWVTKRWPDEGPQLRLRDTEGKVIRHEYTNGVQEWIVWFPRWKGTRGQVLAMMHECQHLALQILRYVGIDLVEESEEAFTYLAEALAESVWAALDKAR